MCCCVVYLVQRHTLQLHGRHGCGCGCGLCIVKGKGDRAREEKGKEEICVVWCGKRMRMDECRLVQEEWCIGLGKEWWVSQDRRSTIHTYVYMYPHKNKLRAHTGSNRPTFKWSNVVEFQTTFNIIIPLLLWRPHGAASVQQAEGGMQQVPLLCRSDSQSCLWVPASRVQRCLKHALMSAPASSSWTES